MNRKELVKNILAGFGAVFIVILLGIGVIYLRWMMLNHGATSFAAETVTVVSEKWSYEELKKRADGRMLNQPEDKQRDIFKRFSTLGKLKGKPECQGKTGVRVGATPPLSAQYVCKAQYEKDTALIGLALVGDYGNNWKVVGMNFASDHLVKNDAKNGKE